MTRRYASTGRFRPAPPFADAPLFAPVKCERVAKGNRTKAARNRALVQAVAEKLRAEVAGRVHPFDAWMEGFI